MSWFWKSLKCYQNPGSCSVENGVGELKKLKDFEERSKLVAGDGDSPQLFYGELLKINQALQKDKELYFKMRDRPHHHYDDAIYDSSSIHSRAFQLAIKYLKAEKKYSYTSMIGRRNYIEPEKIENILQKMPNDWRSSKWVGYYHSHSENCWLANLITDPQIFRSVVFDGSMDFKQVDNKCWQLTMKKATNKQDRELLSRLLDKANRDLDSEN